MLTMEDVFPPFRLRIRCGAIEQRVLRDDDIPELVDLVRGGVQAPGTPMPFLADWHEAPFAPGQPGAFPAVSLSWWWQQRAAFAPDAWHLALTVRHDGVLVGMQDVPATDFPLTRTVETGSWLGRDHQGKGIGTLMRQMAISFAFDELDAVACESGYIVGNEASRAVSRKAGYVDNGQRTLVQQTRQGAVRAQEQRVIVTPDAVVRPGERVVVEGAEELRRFLSIER